MTDQASSEESALAVVAKKTQSIAEYEAQKNLTEVEKRQAKEIASGLDLLGNPNAVSNFAIGAQAEMARSAKPLMQSVRSKDTGAAGEILRDLLAETSSIDPSALQATNNALSRIPIIGGLFNAAEKLARQYEVSGNQIAELKHKLEGQVRILQDDTGMLEDLFDDNYSHFRMLQVYIAAGEIKVVELASKQRYAVRKAERSEDPFDVQAAADLRDLVSRFERRIYDLKLSAVIAVQTAPQIRLVQSSNTALSDKMQSSLMITLPLWEQQFVIAMALYRQQNGLKLQKAVTEKTNELLSANAKMLQQGTVAIAQETERGIVEIETLRETQTLLKETIGEVIQIQETGRQQRAANEKEMAQLEEGLQKELLQLQG